MRTAYIFLLIVLCAALSFGQSVQGTSNAAGTFTATIRVTDNAAATSSQAISVLINTNAAPDSITTSSLPDGGATIAYSQSLAGTGGTLPYTWTINGGGTLASQGAACTGLSLSSAGAITGTPTTAGTCSFTAKLTDAAGSFATKALSIVIRHDVTLSWVASSGATGYKVYRSTVSGSGYGLISPGVISGTSYNDSTVSNATTYYYVVSATNSAGDSGFSNQSAAVIP